MTSVLSAKFLSLLRCIKINSIYPLFSFERSISTSLVDYAARKGTREKAKKKKVKVEIKKLDFVASKMKLKKAKLQQSEQKVDEVVVDKHATDDHKPEPVDDVYVINEFRLKTYPFSEIIKFFEESHHPTMLNLPDAPVTAEIELNMQGEKKTKFREGFTRLALFPHSFICNDKRTIIAFCKDQDLQEKLREAGADYVGGTDIIRRIQKGELKTGEFKYALAHSEIMGEMFAIRGLMKKKFPSNISGTISNDILNLVSKFRHGIEYVSIKDERQPNFAVVQIDIGTLSMGVEKLEQNFIAVLKDVDSVRPKREGTFITRCYLKCPPSDEKFKLDPFLHVEKERKVVKVKGTNEIQFDDEDVQPETPKNEPVLAEQQK